MSHVPNLCASASLADEVKGGDGAKSALREIFCLGNRSALFELSGFVVLIGSRWMQAGWKQSW
jgi:hypothetical protein